MFNEEEKKAIEMIEIIVDECKLENKRKGYEGTYYDGDTPIPYKEYETVLNLITKLQKENEEIKSKNKHLKSENNAYGNEIVRQNLEIVEKDRYIKNSEEITTEMNNDIKKLLLENKQKEKQIDLMAEHIVSSAIVDDTVCAIKCDCESDVLEDCSHEKMLNCTKQYFETKAKKGE